MLVKTFDSDSDGQHLSLIPLSRIFQPLCFCTIFQRYFVDAQYQPEVWTHLEKQALPLTWPQVLGVSDKVLHGLHHLSHCQVLQDAFTHTNDLTHLRHNTDTVTSR